MSLPGAGETEHQTVLERLNSNQSLNSEETITAKITDNENETDQVDFIAESSGELKQDQISGDNHILLEKKSIENNNNCLKPSTSVEAVKEIFEEETVVIDVIEIKCTPIEDDSKKPPIPLQTYCWEELRRSKEKVFKNCFVVLLCGLMYLNCFFFSPYQRIGWISLDTFI